MFDFLFRRSNIKTVNFDTGFKFSTLCVIVNDLSALRPLRIDLTKDTINRENNLNIPVSKYIKIFYHKNFKNTHPHFYHSIKTKDKQNHSALLKFDKSYIILDCTIKKQRIKNIIKSLGFSENSDFEIINEAVVANDIDNYFFTYIMIQDQLYGVVRYNLAIGENYNKVDFQTDQKEFIITKENSKNFYICDLNCILSFCKIEDRNKAMEFIARRTIMKEIEESIKCEGE